jgi:predicted transcriptional regulator
MAIETLTFKVDATRRAELDMLASSLGQDREQILRAALDAYMDVQRWQREHIVRGLQQADAGEFATEAQVADVIARLST